MGNSESREEGSNNTNQASTATSPFTTQRDRDRDRDHRSKAPSARRPHAHSLASSTTSTGPGPTPPTTTATLVHSSSSASRTSNADSRRLASHSPASSTHIRQRSINTARGPSLESPDSHATGRSEIIAMGNTESRQRPPSRSATQFAGASEQEKAASSPVAHPQPPPESQQLDVFDEKDPFDNLPSGAIYDLPPSNFSRPPRLPLPIEEEVEAPGSPILTPQALGPALDQQQLQQLEADGTLPRRSSILSSTTGDDDDVLDPEALLNDYNNLGPTVPTTVEWRGETTERVYVTGTFAHWERKVRMYLDPQRGVYSVTLPLKPGTHHLKFIIDNEPSTSNDLPTTVDWTNVLVNYIEVVAPLPGTAATQTVQPPATPAEPMPIPGATLAAGQTLPPTRPLDIRTAAHASDTESERTSRDAALSQSRTPHLSSSSHQQSSSPSARASKPKAPSLRPKYTTSPPTFLTDLDLSNPSLPQCQRANRVASHLPHPPSLPMFLGKSILNGATPHKDDASVLIMPNHTVLNHLATSSIKSGVLATSGTTRYKRKFLTTIMYKPTSDA